MEPPRIFRQGEQVTYVGQGREVVGTVLMASPNGQSLTLVFDEGIPIPMGCTLLGDKQAIMAAWRDKWIDIFVPKREFDLK